MKSALVALLLACGLGLSPAPGASQDKDELEKKAEEWIALLRTGQFDSAAARVAPVARTSMGPTQLAMIWPQIRERFGELEKVTPINRLEQGGYVVIQLLGSFAKGAQTIRVAFDRDALVAGFFVVGPPSEAGRAPPFPSTSPRLAHGQTAGQKIDFAIIMWTPTLPSTSSVMRRSAAMLASR
jgi:hypothetical protein